ncbi:unnamed protein product [Arctogadus glacialis]
MRVSSVKSVLANYESLASYFRDFSEMSNGDACSKCSGFLKQLRKFSFYSTLRLLVDVMYPMEEVNAAIQSPKLSLSDVKKKIDVPLCSLQSKRSAASFSAVYQNVVQGAQESPTVADRAPRKDLSQVLGNVRVRVKRSRKQRVETATIALTDQEEVKPFRPFRTEPLQTH